MTKSRCSPENSHIPDALKDGSDSLGRTMTQLKYCMALLLSINQEIKADSSSYLETKVSYRNYYTLYIVQKLL